MNILEHLKNLPLNVPKKKKIMKKQNSNHSEKSIKLRIIRIIFFRMDSIIYL